MSFGTLGLSARSLENVRAAGYDRPTPIQLAAIPLALQGRDVLGCAQTGTGKTAAFVLPTLERLASRPGSCALVLAPTRELASQIADAVEFLSGSKPPRVAVILGGVGMEGQVRALRAQPEFIIATPGRLIDHLDRGTVRLENVSVLVLDEADRMLDMGFAPQLRRILTRLPAQRQTLLFSATMPAPGDDRWRDVLSVGLKDPARVSVDPPRVAARAEQALWYVDQSGKTQALLELLGDEPGSVIVFTRTKHRADRLSRQLVAAGHSADRIHGDRSQPQRERALEGFRTNRLRVLVATDIAARGLDVEGVAHVVNYDLPADPEDYVHRIGRTARAERAGRATSFVTGEDRPTLKLIERLTGQRLPPLVERVPMPASEPLPRAPSTVSRHAPAPRPAPPAQGSHRHPQARAAAPVSAPRRRPAPRFVQT